MALSANELITQYKNEFDFCEKEYMKAWKSIIIDVDENASESKKTAARREAQKWQLIMLLFNQWQNFQISMKRSYGH